MADPKLFQIVHINIRGIRANQTNLQYYLQQRKYPDVITINESKLNANQPFTLPYYDCVATKGTCPYGSLILKRKDIPDVNEIEELKGFNEEVVGIRINGNSTRPTVNVVTLYNPPNTMVNSDIIDAIKKLRGRTILTGDFNCKNLCWGSTMTDAQGESLLRDINRALFLILNDGKKTRYNPTTGNEQALDLMMTNSNMFSDFVDWNVDEDIGSDHYPIRATFLTSNGIYKKSHSYRNIKDTDWAKFRSKLSNISTTLPTTANELDQAVKELTEIIMDSYEATCPLKQNRFPNSPPFSPDMIQMVKQKRKLRREKAQAKANGDTLRVGQLQREINKKNNDLKHAQKINKRQNIMRQCHELNREKDSGNFFKLFETIKGKKKSHVNSGQINDGPDMATTDKQKANLFAKRLQRLHKTSENASFNKEWKSTVESHIKNKKETFEVNKEKPYTEKEKGDDDQLMAKITKDEIVNQLKKCKNKSAPGNDGLNYLILKRLPPNIFNYLTALFNTALSIGYFPLSWKQATIKMVPKPGKNHKEAKNWRPISLLSCLGKIFERIINSRISQHLEQKNLLSPSQSGFRKGRMTTEQLFRLSEDAHNSLKKKGITAALLLDAEAAFDQAWHDAIRYKVEKLGLPTRLVRLISSFLSDRKLTVSVGEQTSNSINMEAGTPQGSVLSPLLYIILVNDIPSVAKSAMIGQFADDIALWSNAYTLPACLHRLQAAVNVVEGWCRRWRIKLNGTKSNLLIFTNTREKPSNDSSLQLFNEIIRPTTNAKYLGVEFDSKLKFDQHMNTLEQKASSRLNVFKLLVKNGVDNGVLIRLYKTYVRPLFEYGSISFLPANTQRLQRIQNEFIRLSLRLPKYLRTNLIHEAAGLEILENRLLELNYGFFKKIGNLAGVREVTDRSKETIALNNKKSPLDKLLTYKTT